MSNTGNGRAAVIAAAIAAFGICYGRVFVSLIDTWSTNYLYSYGFAIPFIAAYIAWSRFDASSTSHDVPDYLLGVPVTLVGLVMLSIGSLGAIGVLEQASLVVTLAGMVLMLFGRATLSLHWFAIACLLLMIPVWSYPIDLLQDPSRLLSTKIAVGMLRVIGMPVLQQATNIVLPGHTLAVLRECSGVNQLIAITAMVLPAAYLWLPTNLRRIAIIALAVFVSYLGNGARIALTGWLAVRGLSDGNPGTLHLTEGLVISALGYLIIGGGFSLLSTHKGAGSIPGQPAAVDGAVSARPFARRRLAIDVTMLVVLLVAGGVRLAAMSRDVPLRSALASMENRVGDWAMEAGQEQAAVPFPAIDDELVGAYPTAAGERRFAAVDDELIRAYRRPSGARVQVYVAYYRRQEQAKDLSGEISHDLERSASSVALTGNAGPLEIKEIVRQESGLTRGVLFWYDINGHVVSDIYSVKSRTLWDALTRRRTNGALIMVAWTAPIGPSSDAARQNAIGFAETLMPVLRQHLPY